MDQQDRKRGFNKAFQSASQHMGDPFRKALRSVAASSAASAPQIFYTPAEPFSSDKENETPFLQVKGAPPVAPGVPKADYPSQQAFAPHLDRVPGRFPLSTQFLHDISEQHHPGKGLEGSTMPPVLGRESYANAPMQLTPLNQPIFSSSPTGFTSDPKSSSPSNDVLGACVDSEPGPVILEDSNTGFHDQVVSMGPSTPSTLHFKELSLLDSPKRQVPVLRSRSLIGAKRANVFVMPTAFQTCFPGILPNEIIISFDKGKQIMKTDKYPLCNESRFFAQMLDSLFIEGHTRCIRLRDDFPYAITALVHFIEMGIYVFNPQMRVQYPNITLLDLHIHAYIVGSKYELPRLCEHAISEYINVCEMILSMGITPDPIDSNSNALVPMYGFSNDATDPATQPTFSSAPDPTANAVSNIFNTFLDSLVLLWRNTHHRNDPLRQAVLELIKPELNKFMKVRFFTTLMMEMVGFGDDVMHSLAEDGFDIKAVPVPAQLKRRWGVRFGGA
ncbi:hypothetical protein EJ02DRAFT_423075 [Clathrospora elynae]|uniref:BTB domain-containing protein n=1 Tax=Clathrospora elynae TaxID=706981 RepID=A0A6A5SL58_9PLEO|nr:hypothetical protein EJ02DRAFT_423075 [Clathrospora elynae]